MLYTSAILITFAMLFCYADCTSLIAVWQFVLSFGTALNSVSIALAIVFVVIVQGSG